MSDNSLRKLQSQQTEGNQRNVDKDNILLTENYGGLNTESSPINMPLTDSPAVMNVEITSSGVLRKRRGSRLMNDTTIGTIDQIVPIKLNTGDLIFLYLGSTGISIQPDAYDNTTELYAVANILPSSSVTNVSYATTTNDDTTYVYFAREDSPPIVIEVTQVEASNTGTGVTIPRKYDAASRDTSKVTNCKFLDAGGSWNSFTSINASTGAGVLTSDPGINGTGLFVSFHWHWVGQTIWRDKGHIQYTYVREYSTNASASVELSVKLKQALFNQQVASIQYKYGQNNGTTRTSGVSRTSLAFLTGRTHIGVATPPATLTASVSPQLNSTNVSTTWWANTGTRPFLGAYSSVSGNVVSSDISDFYAFEPTHILYGGNYYTDAGYTVPLAPGGATVFSDIYIPFDAGTGAKQTELTADTNSVATLGIFAGTFAWQTTGYNMKLEYNTSDAGGAYTTTCPNTSTDGQWLNSYIGANVGLIGESMRVTKHTVPTGAGSAAVAGSNKVGVEKYDGRYFTQYGLIDYMNYKVGAYCSVVGTYQNRLCYAGFVSNSGTLLFSNVGTSDETFFTVKHPHMNFDVSYTDSELATSPVAISLNLEAGEKIVCMKQWYDDLFVGTNHSIYRIHGGDNVAITPTNFFVAKVANVGTIRNGMTLTDDGIVFLSNSGVYKIYLDVNTGAYGTSNIGIKIRPEIRKGMDGNRFFNSIGRVAYDNVNNVIYVLTGSEYGSTAPRRCFVFFGDREAWSEYGMYNGFMNALAVASIDGRVFMGVKGTTSTYSSLAEFNLDSIYTDLYSAKTLSDSTDIGYDLDVSQVSWSRSDYVADEDVFLTFGGLLKVNPITDVDYYISVVSGVGVGTLGTDYWRHRDNSMVVEGSTFWTGIDTLYANIVQNETNYRHLNVYSLADEEYLELTDLDYTDDMNVQAAVGSGYDGASVITNLSYPTWWVSPAFTRNDIKDLKRMHHFYGVFQNSLLPANRTYTSPTWEALHSFNLTLIQNGTLGGATTFTNLGSDDVRDITSQVPAWLDYFRVSLPIKGNFVSFQACIHSFDRGQWELVGYQIETDTEGRTSRRAYNE